jgi:hypothetical protein
MLGRAFVAVAIAEFAAEFLGGRRGSDSMTRIGAVQVRTRALQCPAASLSDIGQGSAAGRGMADECVAAVVNCQHTEPSGAEDHSRRPKALSQRVA